MKKAPGPLSRLVDYAENYTITPAAYIAVFLCVSFVRNFLEGAAESSRALGTSRSLETAITQMGVLFNLEWITLLSAVALAMSAAAKKPVAAVLRITLLFYIWIAVVPVFDFIAYFPSGCSIDYIYTVGGYVNALLYFFVPSMNINVCAGIRFEVFAAFIICASYVYMHTKSIPRAAAGALCVYVLAVSSMAYPVFILLPALAFHTASPDAFIHEFFYGQSMGYGFLEKNSLMIFFLLVPLLAAIYRVHFGKNGFAALLRALFSARCLSIPALFFAGFMAAHPGYALFSQPFDSAYLAAGVLLFLIAGFTEISASGKTEGAALTAAVCMIAAVSFALSFQVFMVVVFGICAATLLYRPPFSLRQFAFFRYTSAALFAFLSYISGHAAVTGATTLSSLNIGAAIAVSAVPMFMMFPQASKFSTAASALLVAAYMIVPVFAANPYIFFASLAASLLSAAFKYIPALKRFTITGPYVIYIVFLVTYGIMSRF
jgi:hypothetical protein